MTRPDPGTWSVLGVLRLLALFAVALAYTATLVHWSEMWGRLSHSPCFDDVNYLLDGLRRYYAFHDYDYIHTGDYHVAGSWLAMIWTDPPHSPFSTYLAAIAYGVLGPSVTAPYYGNVVIIFGLLCAAEYFTRGIGPLQRVLLILIPLVFPLAGLAVTEFRPDLAYSLATAVGTVLLVRRPLAQMPTGELVVAGLLFAAGLVIKTTTFPLVIAVLGTSLLVSSLDQLWPLKRERVVATAWRWAWVLLPVLILAAPFYIVSFEKISNYLYGALVASGDLYVRKVTPLERFTFYFTSLPRYEGLGQVAFFIPWAIGLLLVALGFGLRVDGRRYLRLLAPLLIAYAIMTLSPMKYLFAGAYFYWLLILGSVLILRDLWEACETRAARSPATDLFSLGLHGLAFAVLLSWGPPVLYRVGSKERALFDAVAKAEQKMVADLAEDVAPVGPVSVSMPFALNRGIVPASVEYLLWLHGRTNVEVFHNLHTRDMAYLFREIDQSDYVITTEGDNNYLFSGLELDKKLDAINQRLQTGEQFRQLGTWELPYGNSLIVYKRVKPAAAE